MTPTASFTARRRRFTALLAAFVLFAGQLVLQQHVHAGDFPESTCVVCIQADSTPVAETVTSLDTPCGEVTCSASQLPRSPSAVVATSYFPRAPPIS